MDFQWNMFTDKMKRVYDNYGIAQISVLYTCLSYTGALYGTMQLYLMMMK